MTNAILKVPIPKNEPILNYAPGSPEKNAVKDKLNDLLNHVPAAIYSAKPSGNYSATYVSENVKKITGYNSKDFIKNPNFWIEHIHPDDISLVNHEMEKFFKKGNHRYEYRFKCKDGKYIWINDVMTLSYDDKKQPI